MGEHYIMDARGEPVSVDLMTWARWYEHADRTIARDEVDDCEVSTVFLGLDHSFGGGPPVLWETMIFQPGRHAGRLPLPRFGENPESPEAWETYNASLGPRDGEQWRWRSRAEALAGHASVVFELRGGMRPTRQFD